MRREEGSGVSIGRWRVEDRKAENGVGTGKVESWKTESGVKVTAAASVSSCQSVLC